MCILVSHCPPLSFSVFSLFPSSLDLFFSTARLSTSLAAYKHADGKKIDGRRVLVDVERGRTVKGWQPRRLGEHFLFSSNQVCFSSPCVSNVAPGSPMPCKVWLLSAPISVKFLLIQKILISCFFQDSSPPGAGLDTPVLKQSQNCQPLVKMVWLGLYVLL